MGLTVSEKSVFPISFPFEKHKWLQKILFDAICLEIRRNGVTFFLTAVDENWLNRKCSYWTLDFI